MLRVLVLLIALCGVAGAQDFMPEARKVTDAALKRYDSEIDSRNFLLRINDLMDDSRLANTKNARTHLIQEKAAFDKDPSLRGLEDVQTAAKRLQGAIDAYRGEAKTTMLKIGAVLVLAVLVVFGGGIYALMKRKAASRFRR